jgi:hypothetical protein
LKSAVVAQVLLDGAHLCRKNLALAIRDMAENVDVGKLEDAQSDRDMEKNLLEDGDNQKNEAQLSENNDTDV